MAGITTPVASVTYQVPLAGTLTIDALLDGSKWGGDTGTGVQLTYSFPYANGTLASWAPDYSDVNEPAYSPSGLTASQQAAAREALQQWANVANISFSEVAETAADAGDIRFAYTNLPELQNWWGWSYMPDDYYPSGGDIWINPEYKYDSWAVGSYNFSSLLHELGHVLGLKHPFESYPMLPESQDSIQYTLMSYTGHPHNLFLDVTYSGSSYSGDYDYIEPGTPMLYDIAAVQYLYGANTSYHAGDDTYSFDPATPFFMTIWDAGGVDTISVSNFTRGCTIDLRAGQYSSIAIPSDPVPATAVGWLTPTYDGTDNLAIAYGVTIENAIGGSGNDILIGNQAANRLTGGAGNDTLIGGGGIDTAICSSSQLETYTLARNADGSFALGSSLEGSDTLYGIERLEAPSIKWALDMGASESTGQTVLVLGAAFGPSAIGNAAYVGVGISLFDGGWSLEQVCQLAIGTDLFQGLAGSAGNSAFVDLVYRNVVGVPPSVADHDYFVSLLQGSGGTMSQAQLLAWAATCQVNQEHVNLVGLQATGLPYL